MAAGSKVKDEVSRTTICCGFPTCGKMAQPEDSSSLFVLKTDAALQSLGSSDRSCSKLARAFVNSTLSLSPFVCTTEQRIRLSTKLPLPARPGPCAGRDESGRATSLRASITEERFVNDSV